MKLIPLISAFAFAMLSASQLAAAQRGQGHWKIECFPTGTTTGTVSGPNGTYPWAGDPEMMSWGDGIYKGEEFEMMPLAIGPGYSINLSGSGSWKIRATWVDASGLEGAAAVSPPPPSKLLLRIDSTAGWAWGTFGGLIQGADGDASNGFDDPYIFSLGNDGSAAGMRTGSHVKKLTPQNGVAEYTVTQSASGDVSVDQNAPGGQFGVFHTAYAALDTREAIIQRVGAHDEWIDANGNKCGDTIYSIPGDATSGTPIYSQFIPGMAGSWTPYQPQANWPHANVKVKWDGLDASYERSPTYSFDYSFGGCYLQRTNPFYGNGPSSGTLILKLTDLGDGADANDIYMLSYHKPGDNWRKTGTRKEIESGDGQAWTSVSRPPGQNTYTVSTTATRTVAITDEINIQGGFNWTIRKDTLAMPLAVGYKRSSTATVGTSVTGGVSGTWPASAASLTAYTKLTKDFETGLVGKYDAGGCIGRNVYAEQHDMNQTYLTLVVVFYDANGTPIR